MDINKFFEPVKTKGTSLIEIDLVIQNFVQAASAFSRIAYNSVYIIDYKQRGFAYVSDNPIFLCGHSADEVKDMGYAFYLKQVPPEDLELLLEINYAGFMFFENIAVDERLNYSISYDFHLIQPDNSLLLVNHRLTPLMLDSDNNIHFAMCVVSVSSRKEAGNITLREKGKNFTYEYSLSKKKWIRMEGQMLSEKEKLILYLLAQGYNLVDLSKKIFLSPNTIKFHKRNIFKKLEADNISEAITRAVNNNII